MAKLGFKAGCFCIDKNLSHLIASSLPPLRAGSICLAAAAVPHCALSSP
jgi:hypothetical protein